MLLKYICFVFIIISVTSCHKSNSEIVIEGKEYLKNNEWFLSSMIDEIEQIPNLNNKGHVFINNDNYRNEKWKLTYDRAKDKFDTVQIDKKILFKWVNSGVVRSFQYDIINQTTFFTLFLKNKNGLDIVLVHQAGKKYNAMRAITDTSQFDKLKAFRYQIDDHWLLFSGNNFNVPADIIFHEK